MYLAEPSSDVEQGNSSSCFCSASRRWLVQTRRGKGVHHSRGTPRVSAGDSFLSWTGRLISIAFGTVPMLANTRESATMQ